ncbi:MAG: serine hydrolase domain-containing protein [Myxococcota bacterium]|nr:serine hydrolase domain-containing protein [Myxococcota bacterium]
MEKSEPRLEAPSSLLRQAVDTGGIPAASSCVFHQGKVLHLYAFGDPSQGDTTPDSLFDIASITKVVATTTSAAVMVARGALDLDRPVREILEDCPLPDSVTSRTLLSHTSGLEAWRPLFQHVQTDPVASALYDSEPADPGLWARARRLILNAAQAPKLKNDACVYSDLGFIVLGEVIETIGKASLDAVVTELVLQPLQLHNTRYVCLPVQEASVLAKTRHVLPTGTHRPRPPAPGQENLFEPGTGSEENRAEVDDDNAWAMGGVAAHAGLFSTAHDVARWGSLVLEEIQGANQLGAGEVLRNWMTRTETGRGLGFDFAQGQGSTAGPRWGQHSDSGGPGHLGFTGCSIWIDRDREISGALLTNRVLPGRESVKPIGQLRPAFYESVLESIER